MSECIFCKQKPAVGITTQLFCGNCSKKDILAKMAALQRDTRFKEGVSEYYDECLEKENVLKTNGELSNYLQKKCVSFSPQHFGFNGLIEDVKKVNKSIPQKIEDKIELRKQTKNELIELNKEIKPLKEEIEKIKDKKGKKNKEKTKEIQDDLKPLERKKKVLESELKRLEKKKSKDVKN